MVNYGKPDLRAGQSLYRRRKKRRQISRKVIALGWGTAILMIIAAVSFAGTRLSSGWLRQQLVSSPVFKLQSVQVRGNRTFTDAEAVRLTGLRPGESIFSMNLDTVRKRLLGHPKVRLAGVWRKWPQEIVIDIEERQPVAVIRAGEDRLVDNEGFLMPLSLGDGGEPLPLLTGIEISRNRVVPGEGMNKLRVGLELAAAIEELSFPRAEEIGYFDLRDSNDAVLVPVTGYPRVHFGKGDITRRLHRWRAVAADIARRWPAVEYIDLRAEGQVVAKPLPPPTESGTGEEGKG